MPTIRLSTELLYPEPLSPLIYGDFMEPLNDLLPGMWAEKLQDRCFEGLLQPEIVWPPGTDWTVPRWKTFVAGTPAFEGWPGGAEDMNMTDASVHFCLDAHRPFVGTHSAQIRIVRGDDRPFTAGLAQHPVSVRAGQRLDFEVYLRGETEGKPITVRIGRHYGVFFRAYASLVFAGVEERWKRFTGSLVCDTTDEEATLAIGLSDNGIIWMDKVSLLPDDNQYGWRTDVVEAIRAMKPGIIRWGGSSLIHYQWQECIGPRESRVPFVNHPWGNREDNDVGIHEFLQFCELVEAEPLMCLNSNSTTLERVLQEIEYCNGPADSPFGRIRAEMGHPATFNVKYWQIGNEQSGETYERTMVAYARAIRKKHPELTLLASYPSDNILLNLSDEVDYVCPHYYKPCTPAGEAELSGLILTIRERAKNPNLKLGITEWNHTAGHWGWARAWLLTQYNALNAARMWHVYQRHGDSIRIANRSNMTNSCNSGVVQTSRSDLYFTPAYYVQQAYAVYSGDEALHVETDADGLDVAATRRSNDGEVTLSVVNYLGAPITITLNLPTSERHFPVNVWTLAAPSLDAVNSFSDKRYVAPVEAEIALKSQAARVTFAAYSVTLLRMKLSTSV